MLEFLNRNIGEVVAIILACLFVVLVLGMFHVTYKHSETMASMGYVEVQKIGSSSTLWVKGE